MVTEKGVVSFFKKLLSYRPKFVLQERLFLANERAEHAERQVAALQAEKSGLEMQLSRVRLDYKNTKQELEALKTLGTDEVKFVSDIEFRCGPKTGGLWKPFCPKCHLPLALEPQNEYATCSDRDCNWMSNMNPAYIRQQQDVLNYAYGGG